jgi:hypothetical protein
MIGLGAALTGQSGLASAGPKFVKGLVIAWASEHTASVLDSHMHLPVVRKAGTFVWFRGPAYRILEKQNGGTMRDSATSFAFQGF